MNDSDVLADLKPYFDKIEENEEEKIIEIYSIFKRELIDNPIKIDGVFLKIKPYMYKNNQKDRLPLFFCNFNEKFVHVVTLKVEGKQKVREFRSERAIRVHWIKPILENSGDKRITRFQYEESNGAIRDYFWYRDKQYIVVVEYVRPDYTLITGFCIDGMNKLYYQNKYIHRIK